MILPIFIAFLLALGLSLTLTPAAKWLAPKVGAVDEPNHRKVHSVPTPRLGGIAVFASIFISLGILYLLDPNTFTYLFSTADNAFISPKQGLLIASALLLVLLLGAWDDIKTLDPGPKFIVQFIAASIIYFAGFKIEIITNPLGVGSLNLNFLSYPLTILWIVGITNAINLIDGLDGLATGTAIIALSAIAAISLAHGQIGTAIVTFLLIGALLGFLWYNFRPATIFLGDSGSLFLGFILAIMSIQSFTKVSTTFSILIPLFALGLPITDTLLSMVRRFFAWFVPGKSNKGKNISFKKAFRSVFQPDKSHIHHQLINYGLSHKRTVLVLYLVSALFGLGAFIVGITERINTTIFIVIMLAVVIKAGINRLKYDEIELFHNGIFFTVYNSLIIDKKYFRKFLDSIFVLAAFIGSLYLLFPEQLKILLSNRNDAALVLGSVYLVQVSILWMTGLYKETIRRLGIADVVNILKSIAAASLSAAVVHYLFLTTTFPFSYLHYILDFYFLGTLILGMRVSFHILRYLFHKSRKKDTRRVLIYGAGEQGFLALQRMLSIDSNQYTPIGFIDEDPKMEGKLINGFTVYGGHWKLERLIKKKNIDELHITEFNLPIEVIRRLNRIAQQYGLEIRLLQIHLKNLNPEPPYKKSKLENLNYAN